MSHSFLLPAPSSSYPSKDVLQVPFRINKTCEMSSSDTLQILCNIREHSRNASYGRAIEVCNALFNGLDVAPEHTTSNRFANQRLNPSQSFCNPGIETLETAVILSVEAISCRSYTSREVSRIVPRLKGFAHNPRHLLLGQIPIWKIAR